MSKSSTSPKTGDKTVKKSPQKKASTKTTRVPSEASQNRRLRQMESKRTAILQAALDIFSRMGVHGSSLDQVANLADVSKTNLLYYFSNKEELYLALLQHLLDVWFSPFDQFTTDNDPNEAIKGYLRAKLELSRDRPAESRLFCMEIMKGGPLQTELDEPIRNTVEVKAAVIQHWVDNGQIAPVDPHHLIFSMWAITQHYADFQAQVEAVTGTNLNDPVFFEAAVTNACNLILNGIRVH